MSIQVQGTLNPFGKPIKKATIQVTSTTTDGALLGTFLKTCTNDLGEYSFELVEGSFLVEYRQDIVLNQVGYVHVNETTKTPITLEELIRTSEIVPVPDAAVPTDWEVALDNHNLDALVNEDINQATCSLGYAKDVEEVSHTEDSVLARNFDEAKSKHSIVTNEQTAFSVEGNTLATSSETLKTPNITFMDKKVLAEDTDTEVSISESVDVKGINLSKSISHTENAVDERTETSEGYKFEGNSNSRDVLIIRNPLDNKISHLVSDNYKSSGVNHEAIKQTELSTQTEYRDSNSQLVNQPLTYTSSNHSLETADTFTNIEEGSEQYVTATGRGHISWFRKLMNLGKEAYDEFSIKDGFSLRKLVVDKFLVGSVFEVDNYNNQVKVNGKLVIQNPDDFKGDTIFEVYQYSSDLVHWFDTFTEDRHWRRHNTSFNGAVDPSKWSEAYRITAEDGHAGDTIYIAYQYSEDLIEWHDVFVDADIWRREQFITNGKPSSAWSEPARIKGADGDNGITQVIEYQYSIDGLTIWHNNFSTGDHYRRERLVIDGIAGEWSQASKLVPIKDEDYADGLIGEHGAGSYIWLRGNLDTVTGQILEDWVKDFVGIDREVPRGAMVQVVNSTDITLATDSDYYIKEGTSVSDWHKTPFIVNGSAVIEGTLAAKALKAKDITGDKISSETTITAGVGNNVAVLNGQHEKWRIYSGNDNPELASFRVDKNGSSYLYSSTLKKVHILSETAGLAGLDIVNDQIIVKDAEGKVRVLMGRLTDA